MINIGIWENFVASVTPNGKHASAVLKRQKKKKKKKEKSVWECTYVHVRDHARLTARPVS